MIQNSVTRRPVLFSRSAVEYWLLPYYSVNPLGFLRILVGFLDYPSEISESDICFTMRKSCIEARDLLIRKLNLIYIDDVSAKNALK